MHIITGTPIMPYCYFTRLFVLCFAAVSVIPAHGAEWRACEQAKLRQLQLQQNSTHTKLSKKKRKSETHQQSAEQIDTWLWKNCREYSYELRQLEQDRM